MLAEDTILRDERADLSVRTSLKTGEGRSALLEKISEILLQGQSCIDIIIPYNEGDRLAQIRSRGRLITEEYLPEGIRVEAYVPESLSHNSAGPS